MAAAPADDKHFPNRNVFSSFLSLEHVSAEIIAGSVGSCQAGVMSFTVFIIMTLVMFSGRQDRTRSAAEHPPVSEVTWTLYPCILDCGLLHIICTVFSFRILNLRSKGGSTVERETSTPLIRRLRGEGGRILMLNMMRGFYQQSTLPGRSYTSSLLEQQQQKQHNTRV